ncbi:copper chaperone CopZ [Guptibacillus hwajinpoensis]|uniref:Copper chaperone CopZ n=1 Tax=Guptibacillus hwajinpoensis TaxID=208199 RepID=A0A0J6CTC4_9BACL|nr:copper chaperone CopZ [Alkalihalobacillus macyae]KMM36345.1 copper-binding protein [Alkalihalobacillus macyae]MDP4553215.1 copper chaperone CopZ [Alkalihalobacillus macyae]
MEQTTLKIDGMTCGHCKSAVTTALKELEGVSGVEVNLEEGTATVSYDDSSVSVSAMNEAVEEQGYDIK